MWRVRKGLYHAVAPNKFDVFYIFYVGALSKCQGFAYGSSEGIDLLKHSASARSAFDKSSYRSETPFSMGVTV